jgi:hypothetical protein
MNNKSIIIAAMLALMVAMTGIAAAQDLILHQGSPNQNLDEPNNITLVPGATHISSIYSQNFKFGKNATANTSQTFPLTTRVECSPDNPSPEDFFCHTTDIVIGINNVAGITNPFPSLGPVFKNNLSILATDSVTFTLISNPQDPLGTSYIVSVTGGPGTSAGETAHASRTITSVPPNHVPEYPAIVLPTVSIMGLVFLLSRRQQN